MNGLRYLAFIALGLLAGCGYHPAGKVTEFPGGIKTLHIKTFTNGTFQPFLEAFMTDRVIAEFAQEGLVTVVEDPEQADGEVSGEVSYYHTKAIAFDRHDQPTEYRSLMKVRATLRRLEDGRVFWKGEASWSQEYPADLNKEAQEINEEAAIRVICQDLAEELYEKMIENF